MRVQELRIGNWVNNRMGHDMQIRDAEDLQDHESHDCFIPIPLTAEWLERFGFWKENNAWVKDRNRKYTNWYFTVFDHGDCLRYNSAEFSPELKYVHQLQNLYFALTGEELTLKEQ